MGPDTMDPMDPSVKIVIAMLARRFMRLRRAYAYEGGRDRLDDMEALARASIVVDPKMHAVFDTFLGCVSGFRTGEARGVRGARFHGLEGIVMDSARKVSEHLLEVLQDPEIQEELDHERLAKEGILR